MQRCFFLSPFPLLPVDSPCSPGSPRRTPLDYPPAGCRLSALRWPLVNAERWTPDAGRWTLNTEYWINAQRLTMVSSTPFRFSSLLTIQIIWLLLFYFNSFLIHPLFIFIFTSNNNCNSINSITISIL